MTKKLVKTMLVCLCLIYTFNAADALGSKSIEAIASAAPSTEMRKEAVVSKAKTETKPEAKAEIKTETEATESVTEIKKTTPEEAKKPAATPVNAEQNVSAVTPAPAQVKPAAAPAPAVKKSSTADIKKTIIDVALSLGVDPYVALSIAKLESGFDQSKRNPSGAVGLYQLMPSTARVLGVNPHIANENIRGGLLYYKQLYKRYGSMELALAAYNAGPGNVAKYKGIPPFRETQAFITKVKREYAVFKSDPLLKPSGTL